MMNPTERVALTCTVNGRTHQLEVAPAETLLQTLRRRLFLLGTKEGCIEGECGACTVLIEDQPVASCIYAAAAADGRNVRTVEGLGDRDRLSPLQQAFVDQAAVQCGFCTPGFLMTLTALLEHDPSPAPDEIRTALAGNLCRCTGYQQIIEAVVGASTAEDGRQ
jgi:carbon-monoxide dehydrogenase small subunit